MSRKIDKQETRMLSQAKQRDAAISYAAVVVLSRSSATLHSYDPETATVCTQMTLTWTS